MAHKDYVGHWEICDCTPRSALDGQQGMNGSIFELTKMGEVRWKLPERTSYFPLLNCDTYELVSRGHCSNTALLRFGTYRGHILEFHIGTFQGEQEFLMLSQGWCLLQCRRVEPPPEGPSPPPYSFLPALEDSYFSDLEIVASNNKVFRVHLCILMMSAPDLDWTSKPPPLAGLPEAVLGTSLHYLYAQCLPSSLTPKTADSVLTMLADVPALHGLRKLCTSFLSHLNFKNRHLQSSTNVDEMASDFSLEMVLLPKQPSLVISSKLVEDCRGPNTIVEIIEILRDVHACAVKMTESFSPQNLLYDPAKLCLTIKQAARDAAVGYAKLILMCDIYNKKKGEFSIEAGKEVIKYIQSRGAVVLIQLKTFLIRVSSALKDLKAPQRQDLASYLVPEVESILDTAGTLLIKAKYVVDNLLKQGLRDELEEARHLVPNYEYNLNNILHKKELIKLRCLLQRITCIHTQLVQQKEDFKMMSNSNKVRFLAHYLEQAIQELPVFLLRLEEVSAALNHKFEWGESQFCFKVTAANVCEMLSKLVRERHLVKDLMIHLCKLVEQDSFSQCIVALGLLSATEAAAIFPTIQLTDTNAEKKTPNRCCMLNITNGLCVSPCAEDNSLSIRAGTLLQAQEMTDVVFEVVETEGKQTRLPAHRVVVAARCDWFRRALLSGMREDIHRHIEVHDTSSQIFCRFLEYLYTGRLGSSSLTGDQLAELLLLSDRYEVDDLKSACEEGLKGHLDQDSWLDLLTLADQFNALSLKQSCVQLLSEEPSLLCEDVCAELPKNLQEEVYEWMKHMSPRGRIYSRRDGDAPSLICLSGKVPISKAKRDELDDAIMKLRNIVGEEISKGHLENVLLAADMDIKRAVDLFYFATS